MKLESYFSLPVLKSAGQMTVHESELLIVSSGFEDRSVAFAKHFLAKGGNAIQIEYVPFDVRNKLEEVTNCLLDIRFQKDKIFNLVYDRKHPIGFADKIVEVLKSEKLSKVYLDISGLSKLAIMLCLDACREAACSVKVFYCEAQDYGPSKTAYEEAKVMGNIRQPSMGVYTGFEDTFRVRRFSSVAMQGAPTAVFSFLSLNEKFIQVLISRLNPSRLFLINSRPPELTWREEAMAWIHKRLVEEWARDNPVDDSNNLPARTASSLEYSETLDVLNDLYWSLADKCRIVLAPTGSKMQAIGCYLFRSIHHDVHVEYPTPHGFLSEYSTGIGRAWCLDLSDISALILELKKVDCQMQLSVRQAS